MIFIRCYYLVSISLPLFDKNKKNIRERKITQLQESLFTHLRQLALST